MNVFKEMIVAFIAVSIGVVILSVVGVLLISISARLACHSSADQNEVNSRYSVLGGCSYQHPTTGLWVPKKNYRAVGD